MIALPVLCVHSVPAQRWPRENWWCCLGTAMKPYEPLKSDRTQRLFERSMPCVQVLRVPMPRPFIAVAKTRLQHSFTAIALNMVRTVSWLTDTSLVEAPQPKTRLSPFAALEKV